MFTLHAKEGKARRGAFVTHHGTFQTPNFMPVGTKATVKGVDVEHLEASGCQITLVNTYHLWLRPGHEFICRRGGVHSFCGWKGPILSDSGGYQVFSLRGIRKLSEEGVEFRSHLDGSKQFLSPEIAVQVQDALGVDIAMVLDECPASDLTESEVARSLEMTLRWAARCLAVERRPTLNLFGITQGGKFSHLRARSAAELSLLPFNGYAIGGLSVGEEKGIMYDVLSYHPEQLPHDKIRYLMGVGTPEDIITAVYNGVDLFDCVMPTRAGRFGRAFVEGEHPYINIKNAQFAEVDEPLSVGCSCIACRRYSRAYIHHLFKSDEMLGPQLVSIHNVTYYLDLMARIRTAIEQGTFEALYNEVKARWRNVGERV